MKAGLVRKISKDLQRMLPKEFQVKKAKVMQGEKLLVLGKYEEQEMILIFNGFGEIRITKNSNGYVAYNGCYKIFARMDILEIIKALAGKCKSYKGVWHWKGETYTQSVPM